MPLNDVPWTLPVTIRLQCGLERTFKGAYEALDFLENEWPLRRGERHEQAMETCLGALKGTIPALTARDAFVAACLEAGMPVMAAPSKGRKPAICSPRPAQVAAIAI
jgi:hypothetical protein